MLNLVPLIGAVIHNRIPEDFIIKALGDNNPFGVVLSFMMGVTTLTLPSLIMLRKAVKPKLLVIFTVICVIGIMGYGVMKMPALVVNEQVTAMGKVLKPAEIVKILEKVSG